MIFSVEFGKHSASGKDKQQNEDAVGYYLPQPPQELQLRGEMFLIADSKGKGQQGYLASKDTIKSVIRGYYEAPWVGNVEEMLITAFKIANGEMCETNFNKDRADYSSTALCCAVIQGNTLYAASVGNCCTFLLSSNYLEMLTPVSARSVDKNEHFINIHANEIIPDSSQMLGINEDVKIDLIKRQVQINDVVFLCTSTIYDSVSDHEIQRIIETLPLSQVCESAIEQALTDKIKDDASAIVIKVKGFKRVFAEEKESHDGEEIKPGISSAPEPSTREEKENSVDEEIKSLEPRDRQIVIKGVRYKSKEQQDQMTPIEKEAVDEFSYNRDIRRPIKKRTAAPSPKSSLPVGKYLNIGIMVLAFILIVFLIVLYGPGYWRSLTTTTVQQFSVPDSSEQSQSVEPETEQAVEDSLQIPIVEPLSEQVEDSTNIVEPLVEQVEDRAKIVVEEEPIITTPPQLKIVLVDGYSRQKLPLKDFMDELKTLSTSSDRFTRLKSAFRMKSSKIIRRRTSDSQREEAIIQRVNQYKKIFARHFKLDPEVVPVDFTLVIGADFKLPAIRDKYNGKPGADKDIYMEILNGYTVAGLAKKMGNQLRNQRFDQKRLVIVDYRNAINQKYTKSFIKCAASQNQQAEELANSMGLPKTIVNVPLFDIKIIIGSDIVF